MKKTPATATAAHLGKLYHYELQRQGFEADKAQQSAVEQLEHLRLQLAAASSAGNSRASLGKLLGRKRVATAGGLYLWGGVGRGKTWLMDLFFDTLAELPRKRLHFHHFMREVHARLTKLKNQREPLKRLAAEFAKETRVLCLDELYVSDIADAMILAGLFDALLAEGVALAITSNTPPNQLYRDGLQRARFLPAIKLLESRLTVHELRGDADYRLRQLRRAAIYHTGNDATAARAALGELFSRLTGVHGEHGAELRIAGRPIAAWRRSSDAVWFGFDALCEGPRSQNDYMEIAAEFHTVFVSDVPQFDARSDDAARRFIALVDEFYDQGVKLIVSAAVAPVQLYRGERLQREFQRTTSRLIEMQSEQYLARAHRRRTR
jgi:cell division protein ZapE